MDKIKNFLQKDVLKVLKVIISFSSFVWLAVLLFIVDIVSKQIILHNMTVSTPPIQLIPNFLSIDYAINDGMAFGIDFRDATLNRVMWAVISIIGAIVLIAVFVYKYKEKTKLVKASLMLMISGCIGNLIDRLFYSAEYLGAETNGVVDFISFQFGDWAFPIFNVADSCLVIGVLLLIVWLLLSEVKELKTKKEKVQVAETSQTTKDEPSVVSETISEDVEVSDKPNE